MERGTALDLRFTVLGPVRARRGEALLNLGSPQTRAVLGALLLRGGRTATAEELLDALWGEEPPQSAIAALRTYASRLRKVLGHDALVTDAGGYRVRVEPGCLDLTVCEGLAAEAEKARGAGEPGRARELYRQALELWSGEPLAGVPGPYAHTHRSRLTEWRLALLENRLELDLELGGHTEAVSELTALSDQHPMRERLRGLLMLALYRGGRQAEALGVYNDTRRLLADELGVDPGPELAELHRRVLQADPSLAPPVHVIGAMSSGGEERQFVRPAQLPATVADFTGRSAFVKELTEQLGSAEGRIMAVSAVAGIGGVGKTTLAVHVAQAAREYFPDGQLYVDLLGQGPRPAAPEAVLGAFLRALGTADAAIPESLEERAALYRSMLAGRRVLALLDNARDAAQVRPLLPGSPGCAVLVTGRTRMVDLAGAHLVDLDVMSPEEALTLFTRIVGEERVAAERDVALDVVGACGFLPLAIRIAASRLATRRTWTVSVLAKKLADGRRRLDELKVGEFDVTATFELGYGQLEPAQARVFRLLAIPEGPDMSLAAAAALLDLDEYEAEEILESLVDISLVESAAPGRYRYHELLRLYARKQTELLETAGEREAALARLLDFYLATARRIYAFENPGDRLLDHLTPTVRPGLEFADAKAALDWLFSEAPCVLATVQQTAAEPGLLRHAADVLLVVRDLMESGVYARQYELATRAVVARAHVHEDARSEGRARVLLGLVHHLVGRIDEADTEVQRALVLGLAAEDPVTCGYAPNVRGLLAIFRRRHEDAAAYFSQALDAFRADGNRYGELSALNNVGRAQLELGQTDAAIRTAEQALPVYRQLGAKLRLANAYYALGFALSKAGRLNEARGRLNQALAIFREGRHRFWEGMTHFRLANVELAAKQPGDAASHAEQALMLLRDIDSDPWRGRTLLVLGHALDRIGHTDRARGCWHEALAIFVRLGIEEADEVRALLPPEDAVAG
jgi:DNA-binding SARP family transcriptional activator/Flp pilus assembly protein TadD